MNRSRLIVWAAIGLALFTAGASAQGLGPFGVGRAEPGFTPQDFGPFASLIAYVVVQQEALYRLFASTLRDSAASSQAALFLVAISFAYGVLHAAGPGHGKAVISSYLLATGETLRRGAIISFAAALVQGASAMVLVGVFAILLQATTASIDQATGVIEIVSYTVIALIGIGLLVRKLWSLRPRRRAAGDLSSAANHVHLPDGSCCASHAADPKLLQGRFDFKTAITAILAVGIRPCTGAIFILVFALSQHVFGVGLWGVLAMSIGTGLTVTGLAALAVGAKSLAVRLAARRSGLAKFAGDIFEIAGAGAVAVFGLLLLSAQLVRLS